MKCSNTNCYNFCFSFKKRDMMKLTVEQRFMEEGETYHVWKQRNTIYLCSACMHEFVEKSGLVNVFDSNGQGRIVTEWEGNRAYRMIRRMKRMWDMVNPNCQCSDCQTKRNEFGNG